ncbi:lipopolysaccharide transport periplasmic protein LptA [Alteromonas aestuariivivens]
MPRILSLLGCLLMAQPALAGTGDFEQPIKVDSKSQFLDGKNKTSLFKDDVHITQGSLAINANEVEVIATDGQGREVFIARGEPASYTQNMDDGTVVSAKANEIRYEVYNRTISLQGNAELQQGTSMVRGNSITYDMSKEQLLATGDDSNEGRVTTVFRPETVKNLNEGEEQPEENDDNRPDDGEEPQN